MKRRKSSSFPSFLFLLLATSTFSTFNFKGAVPRATATVVDPRWAQSSVLLSPSSSPTLLIFSGKTLISGQTVTSTPSTSSSLVLSLSSPISNLLDAPWIIDPSPGPTTAYSSALALSDSTALIFGGDGTGDAAVPVQTANDSSWAVSFPSTSSNLSWVHEATLWDSQPQRRQNAYSASATNGTASRAWIYGGEKSDGSGSSYAELWEFFTGLDASGNLAGTGVWVQWEGTGGPNPMYDGQAVLVSGGSSSGRLPSIYLIGGVEVISGSSILASFEEIWVFTPSQALGVGIWSQVTTTGAPVGRRGHVAVDVGGGKIWIQGGRSLDGSTVFNDSAMLDVATGVWTETSTGGQSVWGHSAAMVGETVVLAFGYGLNSPASVTLSLYSPSNDTWLSSYYPSFALSNPVLTGGSTPVQTSSNVISSTSASFSPTSLSAGLKTNSPSPPTPGSSFTLSPTDIWTAPGGVAPVSSPISSMSAAGSNSATNTNNSGTNGNGSSSPPVGNSANDPSPSKSVVVGVVVGVLAVAGTVVGTVLLVRRRRRRRYHGGRGSRSWDASGSLMAEHRVEKVTPVALRNVGSTAGRRGGLFSGFWAAGGGGRTRFDMLRDEESERWDTISRREANQSPTPWMTFEAERVEEDQRLSLGRRGGMGIWDGFGTPRPAGMERQDSTRSFLSGALGEFVGSSAIAVQEMKDTSAGDFGRGEHANLDLGVGLPPIGEEWDERGMDGYDSSQGHDTEETTGTRSTGTHSFPTTTSSGPTTQSSSPARPSVLSPSGSLYGATFAGIPSAVRPTSSSSDEGHLKRNSSWWNRISRPVTLSSPTATSADRIRDPAQPPSLGIIDESTLPIASPLQGSSSRPPPVAPYDEHGQISHVKTVTREASQRTISSMGSSALEEAMRGMDVVQRIHTANGSMSSSQGSSSIGHGHAKNSNNWHRTSDGNDEIIWDGDNAQDSPFADPQPRSQSPDPFDDSNTPTQSPARRNPPSLPPPTAGVKSMVQKFEQRTASNVEPTPTTSPLPPARSATLGNVKKATLELDKGLGGSTSSCTSRVRVGHGLAKKPVLYVANPDERGNEDVRDGRGSES